MTAAAASPPTPAAGLAGDARLAVGAAELGRLLELGERTIRRMNAAGQLPAPRRIGGSVRWDLTEIREWLAAGCPARPEWARMRGGAA